MNRPNATRLSTVAPSFRSPLLGALVLGLATASTGCGPQDGAEASENLATVSQHSRTDADYAVAFAEVTGAGYQYLTPAWYTASQLTGVGTQALSLLTVPAGWRVTLFSADNFTGSSLLVRHDTDLTGTTFDNRTMSISVEGPVMAYRNDGFHGAGYQAFSIGAYDSAQLTTVPPKTLTSLRVAPGWKVTLYSGAGFTGTTRVVTTDTDLWASHDSFNDQTASLKVEGPVTLFQDDHFGGASQNIQAGYYGSSKLSFGAYQLTSLKVASGWTVTLYSGQDFTGDTRVITADTDLWAIGDFNDQTGSIKVEGPAL